MVYLVDRGFRCILRMTAGDMVVTVGLGEAMNWIYPSHNREFKQPSIQSVAA
jgi:hypothetical protein